MFLWNKARMVETKNSMLKPSTRGSSIVEKGRLNDSVMSAESPRRQNHNTSTSSPGRNKNLAFGDKQPHRARQGEDSVMLQSGRQIHGGELILKNAMPLIGSINISTNQEIIVEGHHANLNKVPRSPKNGH